MPEAITLFILAKNFNWTPEQVRKMDDKDIKSILLILSTVNKIENQEIEKIKKRK